MQDTLKQSGRKLVNIVDPHMKITEDFRQHTECTKGGWTPPDTCEDYEGNYVKSRDHEEYNGICWPGSSSWPDFTRPEVRQWWSEQFTYEKYQDSTPILHIWNDMNEPAVFSGPEKTMPKENIHGKFEHREVHNIYGTYMQRATYEGLLLRDENKKRPFVLSRAFYAGAHRYGAVWTGDNLADWGHLEKSIPMLLGVTIGGLSFCGADVGGFFKDPTPELLVRWYQLAAFTPFFRAHAHIESARREPWLYEEVHLNRIREAIKGRYRLLPYWYTTFYEYSTKGSPVMRPLFLEFFNDKKTYEIENEFMVGDALLVCFVNSQGTSNVYLPEGVWFDLHTYEKFQGGEFTIIAPEDRVPVFIRGGSIIPTKEKQRTSSALMQEDPVTVIVVLDAEQKAKGKMFVDDGESFEYKKGHFILGTFEWNKGILDYSVRYTWNHENKIDKIIIVGLEANPILVRAQGKRNMKFEIQGEIVVVSGEHLNVSEAWSILFNF